jgi:hypothetical protein
VTSQTITHTSHPRPSRPRWWRRRGTHAAVLALAAAAASGLAATPAWAAGGYHVTATIRVGNNPNSVAVSPVGTHIYVVNQRFMTPRGTVSVIIRR